MSNIVRFGTGEGRRTLFFNKDGSVSELRKGPLTFRLDKAPVWSSLQTWAELNGEVFLSSLGRTITKDFKYVISIMLKSGNTDVFYFNKGTEEIVKKTGLYIKNVDSYIPLYFTSYGNLKYNGIIGTKFSELKIKSAALLLKDTAGTFSSLDEDTDDDMPDLIALPIKSLSDFFKELQAEREKEKEVEAQVLTTTVYPFNEVIGATTIYSSPFDPTSLLYVPSTTTEWYRTALPTLEATPLQSSNNFILGSDHLYTPCSVNDDYILKNSLPGSIKDISSNIIDPIITCDGIMIPGSYNALEKDKSVRFVEPSIAVEAVKPVDPVTTIKTEKTVEVVKKRGCFCFA